MDCPTASCGTLKSRQAVPVRQLKNCGESSTLNYQLIAKRQEGGCCFRCKGAEQPNACHKD